MIGVHRSTIEEYAMSQTQTIHAETVDDLLAMVKPDQTRSGRAFVRLVDFETPIWAIILHMTTFGGVADAANPTAAEIADAADAYRISERAARAAVAYYAANRAPIDAWLLILSDG